MLDFPVDWPATIRRKSGNNPRGGRNGNFAEKSPFLQTNYSLTLLPADAAKPQTSIFLNKRFISR